MSVGNSIHNIDDKHWVARSVNINEFAKFVKVIRAVKAVKAVDAVRLLEMAQSKDSSGHLLMLLLRYPKT